MRRIAILTALFLSLPTLAQQSASYKLEEHVFNAGGHPANGTVLASTSYRVTLDSVGESAVRVGLSSTSFHVDGGFTVAYPPPGEVASSCDGTPETCVVFTAKDTLTWPEEDAAKKSGGVYNLYRDDGVQQCDLVTPTASDAENPQGGVLFSYLVTAENNLADEGTQGFDSEGNERTNADPCP